MCSAILKGVFPAVHLARTPPEQRVMLTHLGDAGHAYLARIGRALPRLGRQAE